MMGILKTEFTRFFVLGFAGGAALILGALGVEAAHDLVDGVVPPAHARETR